MQRDGNRWARDQDCRYIGPQPPGHNGSTGHSDFHLSGLLNLKQKVTNTDLKQAVTSCLETLDTFLLRRVTSLGTTVGEILKCHW